MKAILCPGYGSPDVLRLVDADKPEMNENRVLVRIEAAAANPLDWHHMRGEPFLVRMGDGFLKPKDPRLGADFAGLVEAVGANVTQLKPGDAVFGCGPGCFAEYTAVTEKAIALKPDNVSFEAAAATPVAAYTALQGLRDYGKIKAGQKVLINGAAGGVGTFAVQIAKWYGAEVTGVCSTPNLKMVESIGADHVIDYTQENFTRIGQRYDLIFDLAPFYSVSDYMRALTPQGICAIGGFAGMRRLVGHMLLGKRASKPGGQTIGMMGISTPNKEDLEVIRGLLESGKVVPVIDRCYPLRETAEAIRYLEKGHARGKVIVTVANGKH